jgi:hypothetical protein
VLNHFATVANYLLQCQSFCDFVSHSPDHISHFLEWLPRDSRLGREVHGREAACAMGVRLRRSVMGVGTRALTGPNHVRVVRARGAVGWCIYVCVCIYIYLSWWSSPSAALYVYTALFITKMMITNSKMTNKNINHFTILLYHCRPKYINNIK